MVAHNGSQSLTEPTKNDKHFVPFFRRTAIELNNTSIIFLLIGKHQIALNMLADAIKMMNYSIREVDNKSEHQKDVEESIRRAVEALRRYDGLLTRNSDGAHLLCGPRRLHDVDLDGMNIVHRVQEEALILIFNTALTYQEYWISTRAHGSLQNSLSLLKRVLVLFKRENQCTSLDRLHLLTDTLTTMGRVYSHLGQHSFAEACFVRVSRIEAYSILYSSFSAAAA